MPHNIQLAAARDILDRNGIGNTQQIEVLLSPWEAAIEGIIVDEDDDEPRALEGIVIEGEVVSETFEPSDVLTAEDSEPSVNRGRRYR